MTPLLLLCVSLPLILATVSSEDHEGEYALLKIKEKVLDFRFIKFIPKKTSTRTYLWYMSGCIVIKGVKI